MLEYMHTVHIFFQSLVINKIQILYLSSNTHTCTSCACMYMYTHTHTQQWYLVHESARSTWWPGQNKGFIKEEDMKLLHVNMQLIRPTYNVHTCTCIHLYMYSVHYDILTELLLFLSTPLQRMNWDSSIAEHFCDKNSVNIKSGLLFLWHILYPLYSTVPHMYMYMYMYMSTVTYSYESVQLTNNTWIIHY